MTSREDFGRLAYAAYCDMVGRPAVWEGLGPRAQAGWMHVATTVRDRLALGMAHAYRPDDRPQVEESAMALPRSTAHGGSEPPTIVSTDNADLYATEKSAGNDDIRWDGDGPAPDAEPEHVRVEREQREREELDAKRDAEQDARDGVTPTSGARADKVTDDGTGVPPAKTASRSARGKR